MSFIVPFPGGNAVIATFQQHMEATSGIMSFGPAAAARCVVVGAVWLGAPSTCTGCTIGGVAATQIRQTTGTVAAVLFIASVPAGTSGNVVLTFGGTIGLISVSSYSVTGLSTPAASSTAITTSASLNVPAFSSVVAIAGCYQNLSTPSSAWSGLTTDYAVGGLGVNGGGRVTSASLVVTAANPALPVSITIGPSAGGLAVMYAVFSA